MLGSDFQRNLDRYDVDSSPTKAARWSGRASSQIESVLNADVTTAFPVDQAIGDLQARRLCDDRASRKADARDEDYGQLATQWFIVSDLGLTAFSGNDGIHVFVQFARDDRRRRRGIEVRLMARNNEVLATRTTDASGLRAVRGRPRARGGRSVARDADRATPRATTPSST